MGYHVIANSCRLENLHHVTVCDAHIGWSHEITLLVGEWWQISTDSGRLICYGCATSLFQDVSSRLGPSLTRCSDETVADLFWENALRLCFFCWFFWGVRQLQWNLKKKHHLTLTRGRRGRRETEAQTWDQGRCRGLGVGRRNPGVSLQRYRCYEMNTNTVITWPKTAPRCYMNVIQYCWVCCEPVARVQRRFTEKSVWCLFGPPCSTSPRRRVSGAVCSQ